MHAYIYTYCDSIYIYTIYIYNNTYTNDNIMLILNYHKNNVEYIVKTRDNNIMLYNIRKLKIKESNITLL